MKALEIFQTYLDEMSEFMLLGNFEGYASKVAMPFHYLTENASFVISTQDDLRAGFDSFYQTLATQRVSEFIRLAEGATMLGESLVSGRYVTHLLAKGQRVVPPYRSQMILRCEAGVWRAVSIASALSNDRWPLLVPEVSTDDERG